MVGGDEGKTNETREFINATISSLDNRGKLTIEFSELIKVPLLNDEYLAAIRDTINITYTPGEEWPGKQGFNFTVSHLSVSKIVLQITF